MIVKYAIRMEWRKLPFVYLTIRLEGSMLTENLAEARLWADKYIADKVADFLDGIAVKVLVVSNTDVRLAVSRPPNLIPRRYSGDIDYSLLHAICDHPKFVVMKTGLFLDTTKQHWVSDQQHAWSGSKTEALKLSLENHCVGAVAVLETR